jgi:hypothetical protein
MDAKRNFVIGEVVIKGIDNWDRYNKKGNIPVYIICFATLSWHTMWLNKESQLHYVLDEYSVFKSYALPVKIVFSL